MADISGVDPNQRDAANRKEFLSLLAGHFLKRKLELNPSPGQLYHVYSPRKGDRIPKEGFSRVVRCCDGRVSVILEIKVFGSVLEDRSPVKI